MRWFPDEMPTPAASRESLPWWQAAADHRLVVQRCSGCGELRHPPGPTCPNCHVFEHDWLELPGTGTVYTYTVVHQQFVPADVPYVVVAVDLDGAPGIRMVSNLVDGEPSIGLPVEVAWEDMGPDLALPRMRPRG
jgi:uncharacterized OB-fold protein